MSILISKLLSIYLVVIALQQAFFQVSLTFFSLSQGEYIPIIGPLVCLFLVLGISIKLWFSPVNIPLEDRYENTNLNVLQN